MKTKDKSTFRENGIPELLKQAEEVKKKLAELKASRYTKPSKNIREYKTLRQKYAILLTIIKEKELFHG